MANLITSTELKTLRDLGNKIDLSKADESIMLAQNSELYDVLGDFLFDVIDNATDPAWLDLMDGSTFTYNSLSYTHAGIKSLLADLAYSRYLQVININMTPFGAVTKSDDNSTPVDRTTLRDHALQARRDADIKWSLIKKYLETDKSTFSRYFSASNTENVTTSQRWTAI